MTHSRLIPIGILVALTSLSCGDEASGPPGNNTPGVTATGGLPGAGGGAIPGGGGAIPGGGGAIPGGGGAIPGGGGTIPGGGGAIPGGGGSDPSAGGASGGGGAGSGGDDGAGGAVIGGGGVDPVGNDNRAPGFVDLSPPMGTPLPEMGESVTPAPPTGWQWHSIEGAICRDGSPTGIFVYRGSVNKLAIYLEGGGACSNVGFCRFNPRNDDEVLGGDGSTVLGSAAGAIAGRQQPGAYTLGTPAGIFDHGNASNPFQNWNMVYVPYCTGDVHAGTRENATVPGTPGADARDLQQHQFVGYRNMEKIIGRVVPTFTGVESVALMGSSAGSFGALVNFSMVQDAFQNTRVTVIADSGVPFEDQYMFTCMQKRWRTAWGLAFPPDCTECQQADGGGMIRMSDFLMRKHPNASIGLISMMQDEVMRLFFSVGLQNCMNYETADPVATTLGQLDPAIYMAGATYEGGLNALRTEYMDTGRLATFYMPGQAPHQHLFRATFYSASAGGKTIAQFVSDVLAGNVAQLGP